MDFTKELRPYPIYNEHEIVGLLPVSTSQSDIDSDEMELGDESFTAPPPSIVPYLDGLLVTTQKTGRYIELEQLQKAAQ